VASTAMVKERFASPTELVMMRVSLIRDQHKYKVAAAGRKRNPCGG
jgi:hypothetical protein